jgi:surfeit locus 1 family protein
MVGVGLFIGLMFWQLDRAEQKRARQAEFEARMQLPPVEWRGGTMDLRHMRYRKLRLDGHFRQQGQVLLDNAVYEGRPGYQVITPFQLRAGGFVLVDRGWVPQGPRRDVLPDVGVAEGPVRIEGWVDRHRSRPLFSGAQAHQVGDSRWQYLDPVAYQRFSGLKTPDFVIHLAPGSPYGFRRGLPHYDAKVGMHLGYAIQWGAFALIAAGTWVAVSLRRREQVEVS